MLIASKHQAKLATQALSQQLEIITGQKLKLTSAQKLVAQCLGLTTYGNVLDEVEKGRIFRLERLSTDALNTLYEKHKLQVVKSANEQGLCADVVAGSWRSYPVTMVRDDVFYNSLCEGYADFGFEEYTALVRASDLNKNPWSRVDFSPVFDKIFKAEEGERSKHFLAFNAYNRLVNNHIDFIADNLPAEFEHERKVLDDVIASAGDTRRFGPPLRTKVQFVKALFGHLNSKEMAPHIQSMKTDDGYDSPKLFSFYSLKLDEIFPSAQGDLLVDFIERKFGVKAEFYKDEVSNLAFVVSANGERVSQRGSRLAVYDVLTNVSLVHRNRDGVWSSDTDDEENDSFRLVEFESAHYIAQEQMSANDMMIEIAALSSEHTSLSDYLPGAIETLKDTAKQVVVESTQGFVDLYFVETYVSDKRDKDLMRSLVNRVLRQGVAPSAGVLLGSERCAGGYNVAGIEGSALHKLPPLPVL